MKNKDWDFHNSTKIFFGNGSRSKIVERFFNKKVLIVTSSRGRKQFMNDPTLTSILESTEPFWLDSVQPNPSLTDISTASKFFEGYIFDYILGFGGGSSIDTAKVIAAIFASPKKISISQIISEPSIIEENKMSQIVAIPTTSGTGSEVTPYATVWDKDTQLKLSLTSPLILPKLAIVDPELTYDLPLKETISSGLDALNQACESYWNIHRSPLTQSIATLSISKAMTALHSLKDSLLDKEARSKMSEASLLAGLCISQTRTAICHSASYPLTAHYGIPHGLACAATMIPVAEFCENQDLKFFLDLNLKNDEGKILKFLTALRFLFDHLNVDELIREYIPEGISWTKISREIYMPERAANFLFDISQEDIKNFFSRFLN